MMSNIKEDDLKKITGGTEENKGYKCKKCGMTFTSERLYKEHMLVAHGEKV